MDCGHNTNKKVLDKEVLEGLSNNVGIYMGHQAAVQIPDGEQRMAETRSLKRTQIMEPTSFRMMIKEKRRSTRMVSQSTSQ